MAYSEQADSARRVVVTHSEPSPLELRDILLRGEGCMCQARPVMALAVSAMMGVSVPICLRISRVACHPSSRDGWRMLATSSTHCKPSFLV